jgi:hypothetical protein
MQPLKSGASPMTKVMLCIAFLFHFSSNAQYAFVNTLKDEPVLSQPSYTTYGASNSAKKLYQRNIGMIAGLQKGASTAIEFGAEAHWRKISVLNKPHVIGATTNLEYYFSNHVVGYKAGVWMKRGRINLTYGGNISYYNNFKEGSRFGIGPSVGFRLIGFHLVNGINFLTKDNSSNKENPMPVNTLYMSLRYYFPVDNKFTWDRKTMKKKREKRKERAKKKEERQNGERGIKKLFNFGDKENKNEGENESENEEKKGLRKLFNFRKDKT